MLHVPRMGYISRSPGHRTAGAVLALFALGAGVLLSACAGKTAEERAQNGQYVQDVLTTRHAAPHLDSFAATFDQATFTTTYTAQVSLPNEARTDSESYKLHASWSGANCGSSGIVNFLGEYAPGRTEWDFGAAGPITYRWTHPHPPCGNTPDHSDATIKLVVSNAFGSTTCTYVGAASGSGECK